ncbi:MAG: FlgD immunoglobulin-like domain containing protein [Calditrichia bacterium]
MRLRLQSLHNLLLGLEKQPVNVQTYYFMPGQNAGENLAAGVSTANVSIAPLPAEFRLHQNYPNPFNPTTTIAFDLPQDAEVNLQIFDLTGRCIRTLVNGRYSAGRQQAVWDGRNDFGGQAASGIYLCRFRAGSYQQTGKMILMK